MRSLKIYVYKACGSCRKALKYLDEHGVDYEVLPIRETPPTISELRTMLQAYQGDMKRLFNTSGGDYKTLGMKERLPLLSEEETLALLSTHGNLVKRPVVLGAERGLVGFKESEWASLT